MSFRNDFLEAPKATAAIYHPVTIVPARYGGTVEGGAWLAFPVHADIVARYSHLWRGDDVDCEVFWEAHDDLPIGRGSTPDAALADVGQRLASWNGGRHADA